MYVIITSSAFKKHYKKIVENKPLVRNKLEKFIYYIQNNESLPKSFRDHKLIGNYKNCRECHLFPDILLIYIIKENELELLMIDIWSHSDLFD